MRGLNYRELSQFHNGNIVYGITVEGCSIGYVIRSDRGFVPVSPYGRRADDAFKSLRLACRWLYLLSNPVSMAS